jgi:hypothetical protein
MSRRACRLAAVLALAAGVAASTSDAEGRAAAPAPVHAALVVQWGHGAGSDAYRDDFARALAQALGSRCFATVLVADPGAEVPGVDVVLDVVLSDIFDEIRFDDSIATALQPGEPNQELRRVAQFSMTIDAALTPAAGGRTIAAKRFVVNEERRPLYVGEDPLATVRTEAIRDAVRDLVRKLGCGTGALDRKIRDALNETKPEPSGAR